MKHNHKKVEVPHLMKKLPLDKRGYPITFTTTIIDGKPYFEIVDEHKRQTCIREDLCSVCGRKLYKNRSVVGGPLSAFHDGGAFIDVSMHTECARYALEVCPYLAIPNYKKVSDTEKLSEKTGLEVSSNTVMPQRPELFCLVTFKKARLIMHEVVPGMVKYIKPEKPYVGIEFWRDGKVVDHIEGIKLVKEIMTKQYEIDFAEIGKVKV